MAEDNVQTSGGGKEHVALPVKVTLSNGSVAEIIKGKGRHAKKAMMKSEGKGEEYLAILMAELVLVDGKKLVPEDFEEMDMKDYMAIQTAFADVNF